MKQPTTREGALAKAARLQREFDALPPKHPHSRHLQRAGERALELADDLKEKTRGAR